MKPVKFRSLGTPLVFALLFACSVECWAQQWSLLGPEGGDLRSLAYDPRDPNRVLLGTSAGVIFESEDGGHRWARFAHLGATDDLVLDHIVFDPQNSSTIFVSAWSVQDQNTGEIFRSRNGGTDWETLSGMHGKSVRALAIAASDHTTLVAGALDGVYRSRDGGIHWERISPADNADIKNVESIAINPQDSRIVYAGTRHLAWKTIDGGPSWQPINKGVIDDSDIFSIIINPANPSQVFVSACSGIYKSVNAGELFQKIRGVPFSARRTRVLKQDPNNRAIVYAGTTEGLWKSVDEGNSWKRVSNPGIVVNDVLIDPRNSQRILLATDRGGVLASDDGAATLHPSNHGFTHRYVTAILADTRDPKTIYVGVVNDRESGGVFYSADDGQTWQQRSSGLEGRDVFALKQASDGALVAGTNRGVFELARGDSAWKSLNNIAIDKKSMRRVRLKQGKFKFVDSTTGIRSLLQVRVNDVELSRQRWFAATSVGLFTSKNQGKIWTSVPGTDQQNFIAVQSGGKLVAAATHSSLLISRDAGVTWQPSVLDQTNIRSVIVTPYNQVFVTTREGGFQCVEACKIWNRVVAGLPNKDILAVVYDVEHKRFLAATSASNIFESADGSTWQRGPDSGFPLHLISVIHERYIGAATFDGVVAQPQNVQSASANRGLPNK